MRATVLIRYKTKLNRLSVERLTLALKVTLDLEFLLAVVFDAIFHAFRRVAAVLADFIVVGVVAVAVLADHFASILLLVQLSLSVGVNELSHVDNVLSAVLAGGAVARGAERETDQVLGVEHAVLLGFRSDLNKTAASQVTEGVVGNESHIAFFVKVTSRFDDGGLGEHALTQARVGGDIAVRSKAGGGNSRGDQSGKGDTEHHDER